MPWIGGIVSINGSRSHFGKETEQYPDAYPKEYRERVEDFSRNYIWRKITGDITIEFLEAAVERRFTADEVPSVVDLSKLKG